jgi:hypothetical protein
MSIFLSITIVVMLVVFSVDVSQKRRDFLNRHRSIK